MLKFILKKNNNFMESSLIDPNKFWAKFRTKLDLCRLLSIDRKYFSSITNYSGHISALLFSLKCRLYETNPDSGEKVSLFCRIR